MNKSEDQRYEKMAESVIDALGPLTILLRELSPNDAVTERKEDEVCFTLMKLIDSAYSTGYADGMTDEQYAGGAYDRKV
jgi:hypothetical protein